MTRKLARAIALVLSVSVASHAYSQTLETELDRVRTMIRHFQHEIAAHAPEAERRRIESVQIRIARRADDLMGARAFAPDGRGARRVEISTGMLAGLRAYLAAWEIEHHLNRPELTTMYMQYTSEVYELQGAHLKSVEQFAQLDAEEIRQWNETEEFWERQENHFMYALAFVVAHELAHHINDSFYDAKASVDEIRRIETEADAWAVMALTRSGIVAAGGALFANLYLHEVELQFIPLGATRAHPEPLLRINEAITQTLEALPNTDLGNGAVVKSDVRESLRKVQLAVRQRHEDFESRDVDWYIERVDRGSRSAAWHVARMYMTGDRAPKDDKMAFAYCVISAAGGYPRGQALLGYLYQTGTGVERDLGKARMWYKRAAAKGHRLAVANLKTLP